MRLRSVLISFLLMTLISGPVFAQDPMIVPSGEREQTGNAPDNPSARAEYFYHRQTYPGGEIPAGARAKAHGWMTRHMSFYRPSAGKNALVTDPVWKNVGPHNIGGRIIAVAVNPKNPATMFIGAAGGGIWRSYDEGRHWQAVSDALPTQAMGAIVINPVDTAVVYAGTGEASYAQRTFDGAGMFKSTDGGDSWAQIGIGTLPEYSRASDMVINPLNPDIVFAAIPDGVRDPADEGIYRTTDGGDVWELVLDGRMSDIVIDALHPENLYTASSAVFGGGTASRYGMHKSTDGGDSWFKLDVGLTDSLMGRTSIGICAADPDVLYIGVSEITGGTRTHLTGVFKSTDGGNSWKKLEVPFDYMVSQGWYDNIVGVHPENPDIVYVGGVKLLYSTDGGVTWTRVPDQGYGGIVHVDQHAIEFNPDNPETVYLGNDGGFFVGSRNGADWEKRDLGLSITQFIGGAMHPASDALLFGGTQDNGTMLSSDAPMFDLVLYGDGGNGAVDPAKPNIMYTTKETLKFYRSDDFGRTWTRMQYGMGMDRSLFYIDFAMDPNTPENLFLGTSRMYKSTNGGQSWRTVNTCLIPSGGGCYYISAVSVAPYDGRCVFAGGAGGGIALSADEGETWSVVADTSLPEGYVSSVRSFEAGVVYATYSRYGIDKVWRSIDSGRTWQSIHGNLPDLPLNDLIVLDGSVLVASDLGVFISEDGGDGWQRFGTGMPTVSVQRFVYSELTGTLRAITHGRGMYDLTWKQPAPSAPAFLSLPDTALLAIGQEFVYAPVVAAGPPPAYRLLEGQPSAVFDPLLGSIRWSGSDAQLRFTIEASNGEGTATQVFTLRTEQNHTADWEIVSSTPFSTAVNDMDVSGSSTIWLARDSAIVSRSLDGGHTWTDSRLPGTNAQVLVIQSAGDETAWVGTRSGHVFKTTDGGVKWTALLHEVNARFGNLHFHDNLNGIAISPDPDRRDSAMVFITTDGGQNWEWQQSRNYARFPLDRSLHFLDAHSGWYASSNLSSSPPAEAEIYRTTDGGRSWSPTRVSMQTVSSIAFLDKRRGFCIDNMTRIVRRSIDSGRSWRAAFYPVGGLRNIRIHADPVSQAVWIVSDSSAWVSPNGGKTWRETRLLPGGPLQTAVFTDSIRGWAVSKAGILQRQIGNPLLGVNPAHAAIPASLRLAANYPNPLHGREALTMIPFSLGRAMHVSLSVYNSAGVEVARVLDGVFAAGEHVTVFDGSGLAGGVYFYTLRAGKETATRRMVVLR